MRYYIRNKTGKGYFKKGHKFLKGGEKGWFKKGDNVGEKQWNWKGNDVGYFALHDWVERQLGKPNYCEFCGSIGAKKFEWANKSKKYKRDITDWVRLCTKCHHAYDEKSKKMWITRKLKIIKK